MPCLRRTWAPVALSLAVLLPPTHSAYGAERGEVKVYPLGLQDVETAAKVVRAHLSRDGRVFADVPNHRLVVYDRRDVHVRVAAALSLLEVPGRNVRIEVSHRRHETARRETGGASVRLGDGSPSVGVRGGSTRTSRDNLTRQHVVVLDGGRGEIRVSEQVPEAEWFWTWGVGRGHWVEGTRWRDVETSVLVEPRVLPDGRIRVRIIPRFSYWLDRERRSTEIEELSTEVVVVSGQEIDIGGMPLRDEAFRERFLLGIDAAGRTVRSEIRLRATAD